VIVRRIPVSVVGVKALQGSAKFLAFNGGMVALGELPPILRWGVCLSDTLLWSEFQCGCVMSM
jgi:hypothetical protein